MHVRGFLWPYFGDKTNQLSRSFNSGSSEVLAHNLRSLPVSPQKFLPRNASQLTMKRWEFFTTLDYEWRVFRGHIPYRWTIWVCGYDPFALVSCPTWTDFARPIGLLYHSSGWPRGCDALPFWYGRYDADSLSGASQSHITLTHAPVLTGGDPKPWITFLLVSLRPMLAHLLGTAASTCAYNLCRSLPTFLWLLLRY